MVIMKTGKPRQRLSEEHKLNISRALKGRLPKNFALLHSPEIIEKQKKIIKERGLGFQKGNIPWTTGRPNCWGYHTEEAKKKIGEHNKGNKYRLGKTPWNKGIKYPNRSGNQHHNWKGGITPKNKLDRQNFRIFFQKKVYERDNYTCQICGEFGKNLHVDHIKKWSKYPDLRFNIDNCRTLCMPCHYEITFNRPLPDDIKSWGLNLDNMRKLEGGVV